MEIFSGDLNTTMKLITMQLAFAFALILSGAVAQRSPLQRTSPLASARIGGARQVEEPEAPAPEPAGTESEEATPGVPSTSAGTANAIVQPFRHPEFRCQPSQATRRSQGPQAASAKEIIS